MSDTDWVMAFFGLMALGMLLLLMTTDIMRIQEGKESYSHMMVVWASACPLVPFGYGLVCGVIVGVFAGHWWWPSH